MPFLCSIVEEPGEDSEESPRASSLAAAEDKDSSKRDAIEGKTTEKDSSKTFSFGLPPQYPLFNVT